MSDDGYSIRQMTRPELDLAVEWAAAEGWNPGLHDANAFFAADPTGYFAGVLDGDLIASISAVKYGSDYAFVGFYIVKPEHRGKGYGLRLWQHAVDGLAVRTVGLDGVLAQTGNYERSGFAHAYHNQRYRGVASNVRALDASVSVFSPADFVSLEAYDRMCIPAPRSAFLKAWLSLPNSTVRLMREGGRVRGFGMSRPARDGHRVGPLFAEDATVAEALLDALTAGMPADTPFVVDVPRANAAALALVNRRGMRPMFETARMYRGPAPAMNTARVFGVTSLELG